MSWAIHVHTNSNEILTAIVVYSFIQLQLLLHLGLDCSWSRANLGNTAWEEGIHPEWKSWQSNRGHFAHIQYIHSHNYLQQFQEVFLEVKEKWWTQTLSTQGENVIIYTNRTQSLDLNTKAWSCVVVVLPTESNSEGHCKASISTIFVLIVTCFFFFIPTQQKPCLSLFLSQVL